MYIRHTLISVGSLVAHAYARTDMICTWSRRHLRMQALCEWVLMEPEQSLRDRAKTRKRKQRATASQESRAKESERDRVRKKRCMQGESSGHR